MKYITHCYEETLLFGKNLVQRLPIGTVVYLEGEVGAGKTTLVRGFASFFGLDTMVSSPTFTLLNEYKNESVAILHFDLYRLTYPEELVEIGFVDSIEKADYCFIEWSQIGREFIEKECVIMNLSMGESENERVIEVMGLD